MHFSEEGDAGLFVLAHLYHSNPNYKRYCLRAKAEGRFILLDNGAAESSLVTEDVLISIVLELQPDEVIAPDVLFDTDQTLDNLDSFIERMAGIDALGFTKIFFCPQGETQEEWLRAYMIALTNPLVTTIGFSKIAVPKVINNVQLGEDRLIMESRIQLYEYLKEHKLIQKPIHLLGAGDPREFKHYHNDPLMRSTDSCFSILAAMNGISWGDGDFTRVPTPHDYFDQKFHQKPVAIDTAFKNIAYLKTQM